MQAKRIGGIVGVALAASVLAGGGAQAGPWHHGVHGVYAGPMYGGPYWGPGYVQPLVQPYVPPPVYLQPAPVFVQPTPVYVPTTRIVGPVVRPAPVTGMADLAVISFQPVGVRDDAGILKTTIEMEVRNVGSGPAAPSLTSVQLDQGPFYFARTPELVPGESAHLSVEVSGTLRIGTVVHIHADHQNRLEEIRKTNNRLEVSWRG